MAGEFEHTIEAPSQGGQPPENGDAAQADLGVITPVESPVIQSLDDLPVISSATEVTSPTVQQPTVNSEAPQSPEAAAKSGMPPVVKEFLSKQSSVTKDDSSRPVDASTFVSSASSLPEDLSPDTKMAEDVVSAKESNTLKSEVLNAEQKGFLDTGIYALSPEELREQLKIPGKIGPKLSEKIASKIEDLKEYRASLTPEQRELNFKMESAADLMQIPGIGKKRANLLAEKFGLVEAEKVEPEDTVYDDEPFFEEDPEFEIVSASAAWSSQTRTPDSPVVFEPAAQQDPSSDFAPEPGEQSVTMASFAPRVEGQSSPQTETQPQAEHKGIKRLLTKWGALVRKGGSSEDFYTTLVTATPEQQSKLNLVESKSESSLFDRVKTKIEQSNLSSAKKNILAVMAALSTAFTLTTAVEVAEITASELSSLENKLVPLIETASYEPLSQAELLDKMVEHNIASVPPVEAAIPPTNALVADVIKAPVPPFVPPLSSENLLATADTTTPPVAAVVSPEATALHTSVLTPPELSLEKPSLKVESPQIVAAPIGAPEVQPSAQNRDEIGANPAPESTVPSLKNLDGKFKKVPSDEIIEKVKFDSGILFTEVHDKVKGFVAEDPTLVYDAAAANAIMRLYMSANPETDWTALPPQPEFNEVETFEEFKRLTDNGEEVVFLPSADLKLYKALLNPESVNNPALANILSEMKAGTLDVKSMTEEQLDMVAQFALEKSAETSAN